MNRRKTVCSFAGYIYTRILVPTVLRGNALPASSGHAMTCEARRKRGFPRSSVGTRYPSITTNHIVLSTAHPHVF